MAIEAPPDQPFFRKLLAAFRYPMKADGWILLIVGTILFLVLDGVGYLGKFVPFYGVALVGVIGMFGAGYLFAYLRLILNASALGEDEMPDWPEMTGVISAFFELLGTVCFCFAPAIGLTLYAAYMGAHGNNESPSIWLGWAIAASLILGCLYFPMAFLAMAMFDSIGGVNPLLVIPSIAKVLKDYLLTVVMFGLILILRWLAMKYLKVVLPVPLLPTFVSDLVGLYLMTVEARVLGLLYRENKSELGWFP